MKVLIAFAIGFVIGVFISDVEPPEDMTFWLGVWLVGYPPTVALVFRGSFKSAGSIPAEEQKNIIMEIASTQVQVLQIQYKNQGIEDRAERLKLISDFLGRTITCLLYTSDAADD